MNKTNFTGVWRVLLIYVLMLMFGVAIVVKIIYIQTVERERLLEKVNDVKNEDVPAVRGNIFSKNGTLLATTIPVFDVFFDPVAAVDTAFENNVAALSDSLSVMLRIFSSRTCFSSVNTAVSISAGGTISFILLNRSSGIAQLS